ncbi:MAG: PSD1 and planctomycete cytochrome C domain-containing protein [Planctomycetaceae bacterium]
MTVVRPALKLFAAFSVAAIVVLVASVADADDVDYLKEVKPVLRERCFACHGGLKQEGDLRLDTAEFIRQGAAGGDAILNLDDVAASELLRRIQSDDELDQMPPEGERLTAEQIQLVEKWIAQGAKGPEGEAPEENPRDHWSFNPPVRPVVPGDGTGSPIDAFIRVKQQEVGVVPQPPADKLMWLRRVTIDLAGLPPTLEEQQVFLADNSKDAREKVVDRLLESPQYGERWGRHWMDVWRYSDWWGLGAEVRNSQKHIWHWRDWIIESLNDDKGYDQMVREMLAADELYPENPDQLRATGFLARHYFKFNRTTWLDGSIEHTSKAFLGLTFNCAKCHDHKYDPVSQEEYYRFRAIFEPYQLRTDFVAGELDVNNGGIPRAFDCNLEIKTFRHIRGDDRNPDTVELQPGLPAVLANDTWNVQPVDLPPVAWNPGVRPEVVETHLAIARKNIEQAEQELSRQRQVLEQVQKRSQGEAAKTEKTFLVDDDFAKENPAVWTIGDGEWEYRDGKLLQHRAGAQRAVLELKQEPPVDFAATLKFTTTGGDRWKSIGILFDSSVDNENLAYLSAVSGGSKSQVSYLKNGQQVYPPEAAQARKVTEGEPHELKLLVRGQLVNVQVDGEHSIAYQLPVERRPGGLKLIAFDAKVEFHKFTLRQLTAADVLVEPSKSQPTLPKTVEEAQLLVDIAEQDVVQRNAELAGIEARAAADQIRYSESDDADTADAISAAAKAYAEAQLATIQTEVLRARLEVMRAEEAKRGEAEKKLAAAEGKVKTAEEKLTSPGTEYPLLAGAYKTLESNVESEASRSKPFPQTSTGRRTALANWMTNDQNPLLARVAVNHMWGRHFGRPLVATVFDFGRKGAKPTHPELLDWLAVELMQHNWSMKHIHRLIVLSDTYGQRPLNAEASSASREFDPENKTYWYANPTRVEAQVVRDSLLSLAGELDVTMGGPSIPVNDIKSRRRSLYFVHSHNEHQQFLSTFDDADVLECYRRAESIVPQQALALENSEFAREMSQAIAARIEKESPELDDAQFVQQAFRQILCTTPTDEETAVSVRILKQFEELARSKNVNEPTTKARVNFVQALVNHNDFVTVR